MHRFAAIALAFFSLAASADAATVARLGEVTFEITDGKDGELCSALSSGDGNRSGTCGTAPLGRMDAEMLPFATRSASYLGGAVPAGTAQVELEYTDGKRVRGRVTTGPEYTGRQAGKLVFFLIDVTGAVGTTEDRPVLLRRFDEAGTLVGAAGGRADTPIAGPVRLLRRAGATVNAHAERHFAPTPLQLDRTDRSICIGVERATGGGGTCTDPHPFTPKLLVEASQRCGSATILAGFAAPDVTRVDAVLGSGRTVTIRTRELPELGTPLRAVAGVLPRTQAVREAIALDAAGKEIGRQPLGAPPSGRRCAGRNGTSTSVGTGGFDLFDEDFAAAPPDGQQVVLEDGDAQLLARDEGDYLCVDVARLAADKRDCAIPPVEDDFPTILRHATAARTAAGGLVPAGGARVTVEFDGAQPVEAAIGEGGYTGTYRGHVRFYLARLAGRHRVTAVRTYDAAGALLTSFPGPDFTGFAQPATLRRGPGYRLFGGRFDFEVKFPGRPADRTQGGCVGLDVDDLPELCEPLGDFEGHFGWISCKTRRGVLVGRITRNRRGVRLTTAGGQVLRSRTVTVPKRYGGGRVWVLEIPRTARVTRFAFTGGKARAYDLPAPRSQCGYGPPDATV
jgi:hypothetical protein